MNIKEYQEALEKEKEITKEDMISLSEEVSSKVRYQPWLCRYCNHDVAYHICESKYEEIESLGTVKIKIIPYGETVRCRCHNCTCLHTYETFMRTNQGKEFTTK